METQATPQKRIGNTGEWAFVLETPEGKILATSSWGTNYEFAKAQWEAMPVLGAKPKSLFQRLFKNHA
jgi:hypothetical protein